MERFMTPVLPCHVLCWVDLKTFICEEQLRDVASRSNDVTVHTCSPVPLCC